MTVEEWKRKNPPIQRKPITNADRIRAMADEELAEWVLQLTDCVRCYAWTKPESWKEWDSRPCYTGEKPCKQMWIDWLKQEADNGGTG